MSSAGQPLYEALRDGAAFPFQYDVAAGQVLLVGMAADIIAQASFLDHRVLTPSDRRSAISLAEFEDAAAALMPRSPNMIFHQGHCGSTLISRLLSRATASRALREPLVLRAFAALLADVDAGDATVSPAEAMRRLLLFLRCFAQGSEPTVVKTSSICTGLAQPLLSADPALRALFIHVQPDVYLATMLAGPNNRIDMSVFAGLRRKRCRNRGIDIAPLYKLSEGRLAALAWLCEAVSFAAAANDDRLLAIDFDRFLESPADGLAAAARHLSLTTDDAAVAAAINGPDMLTYSKAQEHDYSPALRQEIINQAKLDHALEIEAGLEWLAALASGSAVVGDAMRRLQAITSPRQAGLAEVALRSS